MRYLVFAIIPAIILGTIITNSSVSATTAKLWHTVERINGASKPNVSFSKISVNGNFVVFQSNNGDLVPNDNNNFCDTDGNGVADNSCDDIFLFNRETKNTTLVSASSSGTQSNQRSAFPSISPDAKHIAFSSQASNLVPDGAHNCKYFGEPPTPKQCTDIFVHDLETGTTERVSMTSSGVKTNGNSNFPGISADGHYVVFSSYANNLVPNDVQICPDVFSPSQCSHIFLHDRLTGTTERIDLTSTGEKGNSGSYQPSISADGRHVAFLSTSNNLVPNDNNGQTDIFVRHLDSGQTELVSISSSGNQDNQYAVLSAPAVSTTGRYVAFSSTSTKLVPDDTNGVSDVFVRDTQNGTTIRASVSNSGSQANSKSGSFDPSISSDGNHVLFDSVATNLVPNDTNGSYDIFVRDIQASTTTRVSIAQDGSQGNSGSFAGSISTDGTFATFLSSSNNLIPGDLNNAFDIFVAEASSTPPFPYLSQLDPDWKDLAYDHASASNPFFCGTTIGGCGCAITSSAMLLKYYGVAKSPDGQETNPDTLNTWLKQNSGYAFGALKWNSIATYSVKANEAFGTQKIRFVGTGSANDFQTLDADLTDNKPDILAEPGHFIVATKKDGTVYSIADPAYQSKTSLDAYSNNFTGMRRFEKTNTNLSALYISTPAPNDLFITDSLGRRAGKDLQSGQTFTEIPNSYYFLEPSLTDQTQQNAQTPDSGVNTLVIINPPGGIFNLQSQSGPIDVSAYDALGNIKVKNFSTASPDSFEINYSPNTGSDFSVYQKVKIEVKPQNLNKGNGVIPVTIESDDNFDAQNVDFNSVRFTSAQITPIKFPLLIQNGNDDKKDFQVFFFANEIPPDPNLCLSGITTNGLAFKGCST